MPDAWRFAFFGGGVSGAIMLGFSGTFAGTASAACGATLGPTAAVLADKDVITAFAFASAVVAAVAIAGAALPADNDVADADRAGVADAGVTDAVGTSAGVAVTAVEGGVAGGRLTAWG